MSSESSPLRPIPYDAFTMAAVADEIRGFIGGKVQDARAPHATSLAIELYHHGARGWLFFSCHPLFARAHFTSRRPETTTPPPTFLATIRARLEGGRLERVTQVAADRILRLDFSTASGAHSLIAEIMGKHSNLILIDGNARVIAAAKWVSALRSQRPILSGQPYALPPVIRDAADLTAPLPPREVRARTGGRFADSLPELPEIWQPQLAIGHGAYPVPITSLGYSAHPRETISIALDSHYAELERDAEYLTRKARLLDGIIKQRRSRAATLGTLLGVERDGRGATARRIEGELILAYGPAAPARSRDLEAIDYEGNPLLITLDPELTVVQNANLRFEAAKRAKARAEEIAGQIARFRQELDRLEEFHRRLEAVRSAAELEPLEKEARRARWTIRPPAAVNREERPYEGHRIRELLSPAGFTVLYGENATSNDYLTLRVAKSCDLWFHGRGFTSAHVVLRTGGKPERVQTPDLLFAATIAARHSNQKASQMVAVDVTQRRYVRRPKGGAPGTVTYDHEKTLHVSPAKPN